MTKRIHLISGPRNVSTALMYSFAQRQDITVVDEPLYAYYLSNYYAEHPGKEEIIQSQNQCAASVVREIFLGSYQTNEIFIKNMAHHLVGMDLGFLNELSNIFLIRDPLEVINSFSKVIQDPDMQAIGIQRQYEIYRELTTRGMSPIVIDGSVLRNSPREVLTICCEKIGISFEGSMLSWPIGPKPEDGIWAKYWYTSVHQSTGFKAHEKKEISLSKKLVPLWEEAKTYYDKLYPHSIR